MKHKTKSKKGKTKVVAVSLPPKAMAKIKYKPKDGDIVRVNGELHRGIGVVGNVRHAPSFLVAIGPFVEPMPTFTVYYEGHQAIYYNGDDLKKVVKLGEIEKGKLKKIVELLSPNGGKTNYRYWDD